MCRRGGEVAECAGCYCALENERNRVLEHRDVIIGASGLRKFAITADRDRVAHGLIDGDDFEHRAASRDTGARTPIASFAALVDDHTVDVQAEPFAVITYVLVDVDGYAALLAEVLHKSLTRQRRHPRGDHFRADVEIA